MIKNTIPIKNVRIMEQSWSNYLSYGAEQLKKAVFLDLWFNHSNFSDSDRNNQTIILYIEALQSYIYDAFFFCICTQLFA